MLSPGWWRKANWNFVLEFRHVRAIRRLNEDEQLRAACPDGAIGTQGDNGKVILALSECAADSFGDTHNAERKAPELNLLVERIAVGKQLLHQVLTDDEDAGIVLVVDVADIASLLDFFAANVGETGGHRVELDLVDHVALVARWRTGVEHGHGAEFLVPLAVVAQVFVVLPAKRLVAAARVEETIETLRPLELVQHEPIGAQVGDMLGDIEVHAVDHRHDHDQRGGGNDDAEQRQEGPELVAAQRLQRDPKGLAGV